MKKETKKHNIISITYAFIVGGFKFIYMIFAFCFFDVVSVIFMGLECIVKLGGIQIENPISKRLRKYSERLYDKYWLW